MTKFYHSSESGGPEELVLTPRGADVDAVVEAMAEKIRGYVGSRMQMSEARTIARAALAAAQAVVPAPPSIEALKNRIDTRLNNCLCEMKEGYDDSIVGFNEAWDIVRAIFKELPAPAPWPTEEQLAIEVEKAKIIAANKGQPLDTMSLARAVDALYRNALCPKVKT
jgi:hypothetical protein